MKLECSVPASAKIEIRGTAKSPNRENNVSAEISCSTVCEFDKGKLLDVDQILAELAGLFYT